MKEITEKLPQIGDKAQNHIPKKLNITKQNKGTNQQAENNQSYLKY